MDLQILLLPLYWYRKFVKIHLTISHRFSQMHINALCNTCIDNPGRTDKAKLVESILGRH